MTGFLGPRAWRTRTVPTDTFDTLMGWRKGDPQHKVLRKTVGGEDSKYRCVVNIGFQKTRLY